MIQKLKKSNAGFTLVELIVVIAILGVLAAVLVPQYIQYVEKARVAADDAAVGEIRHAAEIAINEDAVYNEVTTTDQTVTVTVVGGAISCTTANGELEAAIEAVCGSAITIKSATYKNKTTYSFTVNEAAGKITISDGSWT